MEANSYLQKIKRLEARIKQLESQIAALQEDRDYMDQLYQVAKDLIKKHNKSSVIFLQKKLLIDYRRASTIRDRLIANGIVSPPA